MGQLDALLVSDLLDDSEKVFVEAALRVLFEETEAELEEWGDDAEGSAVTGRRVPNSVHKIANAKIEPTTPNSPGRGALSGDTTAEFGI